MAPKKNQVNPVFSDEIFAAIERWAQKEDRSMSWVVRVIVAAVLPRLPDSQALADLKQIVPRLPYSKRVSAGVQDQMHAALHSIFERAPSAIKELERALTKFAGKYGDEK